MKIFWAIGWSLWVFCCAGAANAQILEEGFESVETRLALDTDGTLSVRHDILVTGANKEIKRGIFLKLPPAIGPVSGLRITRNGFPEEYSWQGKKKDVLRIGRRDVPLDPGQYRYVLEYQAKRPFWRVQPKPDSGEDAVLSLTWRPLMARSALPWVPSRLEVSWPERHAPIGVTEGTSKIWRWRGPAGGPEDGEPYRRPVVLTWAEDVFPDSAVRRRMTSPELRYGVPAGFLILWLIFHMTWASVGRDRKPGPISMISGPPGGISPAAARYIRDMGPSRESIAAALMSLVTKGVMSLRKEDKKFVLSLVGDVQAPGVSLEERAFAQELFAEEREITLKKRLTWFIKGVIALTKTLHTEYRGRMYKTNRGPWWRNMLFVGALAIFVFYQLFRQDHADIPDKIGIVVGTISLIAAFIMAVIYIPLYKAPTYEGRALMDRIEGLRLYLASAEPLHGAEAGPAHFLALLPYAVALEVEKEWRYRFGTALDHVEESSIADVLTWYRSLTCDEDGIQSATFGGAIIPAITASGASGSSTAGTSGGGGATAGGW